MPDAIDKSTGKPAMAYVGEAPWHGLGQKLPDGAPTDTWLHAAQLEWSLKRLPVGIDKLTMWGGGYWSGV
jgi:hypothetical protein